jgi:hypothetical protein
MKRWIFGIMILLAMASYGFACQTDPKETFSNSNSNINNNTFTPVNNFSPTVVEGSTNTFSGITGGNLNPGSAGVQTASSTRASSTTVNPAGVGVGGVGQVNNSSSGQTNVGVGNQLNNAGTYIENSGVGAGSVNQKFEEARQMAVVVSGAVTSALRFKEGAHSSITDSRIMPVAEIIGYLGTLEYEECKRGRGDIKVIDGLIRSQFAKTSTITFHEKGIDKSQYRFMGFLTGVAASNDVGMENVVYGVGEAAMEHGATDVVLIKESATEWGDSSGYAFDLGGFVTSIIGGAGSRAIGPGGSVGAGYNAMRGGSSDRGDVKFAVFVSNIRLQEVASKK